MIHKSFEHELPQPFTNSWFGLSSNFHTHNARWLNLSCRNVISHRTKVYERKSVCISTIFTWNYLQNFYINIWLHLHRKDKTKFIESYLFQIIAPKFWVFRYFHLKLHAPTDMLVLSRWNFFFSFAKFFLLCMSKHFRLYLILLGDMNRALAWPWYWMIELNNMEGCKKIQEESKLCG